MTHIHLETPHVQPLPRAHRRFIFAASVFLFVTLVPLLVFYAIGYRFDFSEGGIQNIQSVGGMYVSTEAEDTQIFIDDEPVENMRIFQRAAYIQNLDAGVHQVHVQGEGLTTWVKELPVFAHFVTEANAFNLPLVPHVRYITPYTDIETGGTVVMETDTVPFSYATTTQTFFVATSTRATSTFEKNLEYVYVAQLFASTTEERAQMELAAAYQEETFAFTTAKTTRPTTTATTTVRMSDMELYEHEGLVYARWTGQLRHIPYYFCVNPVASSTPEIYGQHVTEQLQAAVLASEVTAGSGTDATLFEVSNRLCRTEIPIDTKGQAPVWFTFLPDNRDHVIVQLRDGIYVVEIDDRAWQNVQLLYPGTDITLVVDGSRILIQDGDYYLEVYTTL